MEPREAPEALTAEERLREADRDSTRAWRAAAVVIGLLAAYVSVSTGSWGAAVFAASIVTAAVLT